MIADPVFADMLKDTTTTTVDESANHQEQEQGHTHSSHSHVHDRSRKMDRDSAQEKVRSTLRSFVRDWSDAGAPERDACYKPCLEVLERQWPEKSERSGKKVLIPGCGLGRLAMEVAAKGESLVQAWFRSRENDKSVLMDRIRRSGE
jgi:carnosine N-methyltransferase